MKNSKYKIIALVSIALICILYAYKTPSLFKNQESKEIKQTRQVNFPKETEYVDQLPNPDSLYIFIMAGQSNMAGRGFVEPQDTISSKRILTINKNMEWIYAKEPFHFYEPSNTGLDCGMSFARTLVDSLPNGVSIAMIPCAVGGSAIELWVHNETFRDVKLFENFKRKVDFSKKYGNIKGILWHQGESNASPELIANYPILLDSLLTQFRATVRNDSLPILIGELGSYAEPKSKLANWKSINTSIHNIAETDAHIEVVNTADLQHKGDQLHFNSTSQRKLGKRFAKKYLETVTNSRN